MLDHHAQGVATTLTEFLLTRIAEDESTATHYHRLLCLRTACDAECCIWGPDEQEAMERERVCNCGYADRLRAECEAKRRIVKAWSGIPDARDPFAIQARETAGHVFRCLAAVYSDHPDYREEWRA